MYTEGEYLYVEYINGERQRFKRTPNNSTYELEEEESIYTLTEDELKWIRHILRDSDLSSEIELSPSYCYKNKTEDERNENRKIVRKELDDLKDKLIKFTPEELLELKNENNRK